MSTTTDNANTAFIIDSSYDRFYPLFMSHLPDAHEFIDAIPLRDINWDALTALATPGSPTAEHEALLIPTDSARTISVVVGSHVVGTLPDPTLISHSQISRVYASGFIPTCTLKISPGESVLARVFLFKTGGGVPYNDPPEKNWTLLPSGSRWRVEPTRTSPFAGMPDGSQILLELRTSDNLISVYLNGTECGILDLDAADALSQALQVVAESNHLAYVQGCVHYGQEGQASLHIDALAFDRWSQDDFALPTNPLEKLIPYNPEPLAYLDGLNSFVRAHETTRDLARERRLATLSWLQKTGPYFLVILGLFHLLFAVAIDDLSARGLVGVLGLSFLFFCLGAWLLFCQKRDTPRRRQPRHWNFLIPIGVSALIPSVVFANIGIFYDSPDPTSQTSSAGMTTLRNFPDFPTNRSQGRIPDPEVGYLRDPNQDGPSISPLMEIWPETPLNRITASDAEEVSSPVPTTAERSSRTTRPQESDSESEGIPLLPPGTTQVPVETSTAPTQEPPFPLLPVDIEVEETTPVVVPGHPDIITPTDGIPIWGVVAPDDDPPGTEPEATETPEILETPTTSERTPIWQVPETDDALLETESESALSTEETSEETV